MRSAILFPIALALGLALNAANIELPSVRIKHYNFSKTDKDAQMWSALYVGSNGKVYVGLCTHGDAANVYEFDPKTETMRHLANITKLAGERGKGIWTTGKIHVQMQELDGYVYFGTLDEDNGPPVIDATSYIGPHWYRIHMETGRVEQLSLVSDFWGLVGQAMDKKRRIIYGLAEDGHLYRYFIDEDYTEDMGRVDNWDICRTIFLDDDGNLYGSLAPGDIWKYDVNQDRIFDLQFLKLPTLGQSRTMANPMLDRRGQWRVIEWDPADKAAYGIIGGSNMLFKFDPHAGREGENTQLTMMAAPLFRDVPPFEIPHATLSMTLSQTERKIYYIPVVSGDFDYGSISVNTGERPPLSFLVSYDLNTGKREDIGLFRAADGRYAYGTGGAQADAEGRIWFVGAFEEPNKEYEVRKMRGRFPYSMGLGMYNPKEAN
ncbi:MAG: hypothetical protein GY953_24180 [bacterium]|nr:hypothetical protein [bacterium]